MATIHNLNTAKWVPSVRVAYPDVVQWVRDTGSETAPRGMKTREILDVVILSEDPRDSLPYACGRRVNFQLAAYEALQLIGGFSNPERLVKIAPNMQEFMNGAELRGAYGPRVGHEMHHVLQKLLHDSDTRQAVLQVFRHLDIVETDSKDVPCTVSIQFTIRHEQLNCHVHMRSNDVWWGLAYDAFQFTQLQMSVAKSLELDVGRYFHHATSLHLYERNYGDVDNLRPADPRRRHEMPAGIGRQGDKWETIVERAGAIELGQLDDPTESEEWYIAMLENDK